ncbi:hypothetical protein DBR11_24390 [Pedobacter sp. HMWF019]|uniref:DUF1573 domain-containing protein n=1 Tax=Pedobacter sp. HMWF019 TaxID=2056856 RepID=UPI000D3872B1|nr:DUF1573 domain-containing protein [Pedobacter sp. HMWF019]PTS93905.1 hypothetical protein DBR11_24390 [Pedobacter sp. HMWF019]
MRALIYFVFLISLIFTSCKESENRILIDTVYNFRMVSSGDTVKATFTLKNTTNKLLTIEDISSECDCIAPGKKTFKVNPGADDKFDILFLTVGKTGKQERELLVRTDGIPRFYKLKIKGTIK